MDATSSHIGTCVEKLERDKICAGYFANRVFLREESLMSTFEQPRAPRFLAFAPAALLSLGIVAAGCGSNEPAKEAAPVPAPAPAADEHGGHDMATMAATAPNGARVFFVEPKEGATLTSPVHFVFGSEKI